MTGICKEHLHQPDWPDNEIAGDLMISGGNVYSLAYADELVDVPVSSNDFI